MSSASDSDSASEDPKNIEKQRPESLYEIVNLAKPPYGEREKAAGKKLASDIILQYIANLAIEQSGSQFAAGIRDSS